MRLTQGRRKGRTDPKFNLIHQTDSDDEGKIWTKPHPFDFQGVDPDLIEMQNGILVAGFTWRTPESVQLGRNQGTVYVSAGSRSF